MVKIKDIAEATGYSVTTVSKAFNDYQDISDKAKSRILNAAKAMGYIPNAAARGLVTKKSYMIGVIFDEALGLGIRHPFFGAIIEFFKEEMELEGYDLLFISKNIGKGSVKTYIDHCKLRGVDGIFIACANLESDLMKQLIDSSIPSVTVEVSHSGVNSVNSDDYQGAYNAVKYLYELGHRKIAYISGTETTHAGRERLNGYKKAMEELECLANWETEYVVSGGMFSFEDGYEGMKELLKLDTPPTAVFAAGDLMALGALRYLNESGIKVPEDISVMGFDRLDFLDFVTPTLTTVEQNVEQLGRRAAKLLIQNMNDLDMKHKEIYIETKLFEGNSCKPLEV